MSEGKHASEGLAASRRAFLRSCSVLALCLGAGCSRLLLRTRFADHLVNDPHLEDYRAVLRALIATVLPCEHPAFPPISAEQVALRLLKFFPLEKEERYLGLQRSLLFFDDVDLFPRAFGPIVDAEREALDSPGRLAPVEADRLIAAALARDVQLYRTFRAAYWSPKPRFLEHTLETRRAYLRTWARSGFQVKRRFHSSLKSLVMISAYSTEELWRAIGYEGPLVPATRSG